ncbi:pentapeptide repeats family protein, partial [Lyngbya aestuarii BL J]
QVNLNGTQIDESTQLSQKWLLVQKIVTQGAKGWDLSHVDLSCASFVSVDFTDADLTGANLTGTHFSSVDLSNAKVKDASFIGCTGLSKSTKLALKEQGAIVDDELIPAEMKVN